MTSQWNRAHGNRSNLAGTKLVTGSFDVAVDIGRSSAVICSRPVMPT